MFRIVNEDTGAAAVSPVSRVLAEGVVVGLANHTALLARDGARRPIADSGAPIRGPEGEVAGVVLVFRDQTEERARERALEESEQRSTALFEQAPTAISLTRLSDFAITAVNDAFCRLFECTREQVVGRDSVGLGMSSAASRQAFVDRLRATGRVRDVEVERRSLKGTPLQVLLNVDLMRIGDQEFLLSTIQDLTGRRRTERALHEAEERYRQAQKLEGIGRLAGGVAHDFNNLLTVILSCSDELSDDLRRQRPVSAEPVEQIRTAGERARDLTRQLLAFARKQLVAPVELNLVELVESSQKLLGRLLGEDVALAVEAAPGLWPVYGDRGQLEQVLFNLAVNARDAMPRGGRLTVRIRNQGPTPEREGAWVVLEVQDSGPGIAPEVQGHLFEPFFTTKEVGKGTGLGLATVYGIVTQAGGQVGVRSPPGEGATFEVWLPRSTRGAERPLPLPVPSSPSRHAARARETVLVVEDDVQVRGVAVRALEGAGYRVLVAEGPAEALGLEAGALQEVELLVTDVVMPEVDGRTLARALQERKPDLKVLYVSGYTRDAIADRGVLEPGLALLEKPFTGRGLLARVRGMLEPPPGPH